MKEGWEEIEEVLHHQGLLYMPKVIRTKLISRHYDNLLVGYFGFEKTQELIAWKYYLLMLRVNVESYVKGCDMYLASKLVKHKPYGNLQSLLVSTHQ